MFVSMPKILAAIVTAVALAMSAAPARSGETPTADDTARYLAGLPPAPDSPLAALSRDPFWQQHARYFDSIFAREDSNTLAKVRAFSREQLTDKHDAMLYMFSGPDFLYATSFFPTASTYVLAGLEPVGDIPQLTSLSHPALDGSLRNLETSLGSLLSFSFFITRNMKTQLHEGPVYGTLPILYVFLARTGKTVHDVSLVSLDAEGNLQNADAPGSKNRSTVHSAAPGVKIVFSAGNGPKQTLYYFSTNLADGSVERSGFLTFCGKLGPADSFIKSASYLLHTGGFTRIRSFLLNHSATILQDDSGIPLAYFDPRKWRLEPFGRYVGPLSIFGNSYQAGMAELFRHATPIDFGIGYRWRKNESNLLLAQRTGTATAETELVPDLPKDTHKQRGAGSHRKRAESEPAGSFGCRYGGIFPFCSRPPPKASQ